MENINLANNNASVLEEFTRCFILLIGMQFIDYIRATLTLKLANIKMTEVILYTHAHTHIFIKSEMDKLKK